jgi:hypothetical protein
MSSCALALSVRHDGGGVWSDAGVENQLGLFFVCFGLILSKSDTGDTPSDTVFDTG